MNSFPSRPAPGTPARTVCVTVLTCLLMFFLDANRLSGLLERLDVPPAAAAGHILKTLADASGVAAFTRAERELVARATFEHTLGAIPAPRPALPHDVASDVAAGADTHRVRPAQQMPVTSAAHPVPPPSDALPSPASPQTLAPLLSPQAPPPPASEPGKPRVLLIGDSLMMEGFGPVLQRTLRKRPDMDVFREGRYSTGLSRADYFDWPTCLQELMDKHAPDLVVICMGANDPQDIIDENLKRHHADSASWGAIYQARAERLLAVATARGGKVVWMGLPIMSKEPYATRVKRLTSLQKAACEQNGRALFVDSTTVLADGKGAYTTFVTDAKGKHTRLRYKDMVHVTEDGGRLLTAYLVPYIEQALQLSTTVASRQPVLLPPATPPTETLAETPAKTPTEIPTEAQLNPLAGQYAEKRTDPSGTSPALAASPVAVASLQASVSQLGTPLAPLTTGARVAPKATLNQPQVLHLRSVARGKDVAYLAYLPTNASGQHRRFPVLYLLHGAYEDHTVWPRRTGNLLQELAERYQLAIIAPSGEAFGWYVDSPRLPSSQIERFILTELMPHVERTLPVLPIRGIAGISMGGHGAFTLGLRHPGVFVSLSSMSGVLDITRHAEQWKIKTVLGPLQANRARWEASSAQYLLAAVSPARAPAMLVTAGVNDTLILQENRLFRDTLRKGGFTYQYRETPGGHDWNYWKAELPQHIAFHAARLR